MITTKQLKQVLNVLKTLLILLKKIKKLKQRVRKIKKKHSGCTSCVQVINTQLCPVAAHPLEMMLACSEKECNKDEDFGKDKLQSC